MTIRISGLLLGAALALTATAAEAAGLSTPEDWQKLYDACLEGTRLILQQPQAVCACVRDGLQKTPAANLDAKYNEIMARCVDSARRTAADRGKTASYMLPYCKAFIAGEREFTSGFCAGEVAAVSSILEMVRVDPACADIPDSIGTIQLVAVVIRYIEARPNQMHERFTNLAGRALAEAWPCKKGRG